jgi:hypothetical protein
MSNFMTIHQVGAELFYADRTTDRQTDMTKLIVAFRNFAKRAFFFFFFFFVIRARSICPRYTAAYKVYCATLNTPPHVI